MSTKLSSRCFRRFVQRAAAIRAEEKRRDADSRYNNMGQIDKNSKNTKGRYRSSTCSASQQRDSHVKWKKKKGGEDVTYQEKHEEECKKKKIDALQAQRFRRRKKFRVITSRTSPKSIKALSSDMWGIETNSKSKKDKLEFQSQNSDDLNFKKHYCPMPRNEQADPNLDDSPSPGNSIQSTSRDFFPMGRIETDQIALKVLETPSQRAANLIERFNREIHKPEYPSNTQISTSQQSVDSSLKEEPDCTASTFNLPSETYVEENKLQNFIVPPHCICPENELFISGQNKSPGSSKFESKNVIHNCCRQPFMEKETTSPCALTLISNDLNQLEQNTAMAKSIPLEVNSPSVPKHQIENILSSQNYRDQQRGQSNSVEKNKDPELSSRQSLMTNWSSPDSNNSNPNHSDFEKINQATWKLPNLHLFADLSLTPEKFALYCQTATVLVSDINNVLELNSKNKLVNNKRGSIQKLLECLITVWVICRRIMGIMIHPDGIATAEKTLDAIRHVRNELINLVLMVKDGTVRDEFFTRKLNEIDCYVNREKETMFGRLTFEFEKLSPDNQKDLHLFISSIDVQRERAYHIYKQELSRCADLQKKFLLWKSHNVTTAVISRERSPVEGESPSTLQCRAKKRPNESIWSLKQTFDKQRTINATGQIFSQDSTPMSSRSTLQNTMPSSALNTCTMTQPLSTLFNGFAGHQHTTHSLQFPYTFYEQGTWPLYFPQLLHPLLSSSFRANFNPPQIDLPQNHDTKSLETEHCSPSF